MVVMFCSGQSWCLVQCKVAARSVWKKTSHSRWATEQQQICAHTDDCSLIKARKELAPISLQRPEV